MKTTAREGILNRIRRSREGDSGPEGFVPRAYRRSGNRSRREVLDLFVERVSDYKATVIRSTPLALAECIAGALARMGSRRLVVPQDLPSGWLDTALGGGPEILRDGGGAGGAVLSKDQLAACYGVLTGCAHAIAETGTIVLDAGPGQGRRSLSLLPDHHLCVVFQNQVLETVPEAVAAMEAGVKAHRRPFTLISGPSATSDIELIRVEGVHGPRNLEVILVEEEA